MTFVLMTTDAQWSDVMHLQIVDSEINWISGTWFYLFRNWKTNKGISESTKKKTGTLPWILKKKCQRNFNFDPTPVVIA